MPQLRRHLGGGRGEPVDLRIVTLFLALTAGLLAPVAWQAVQPVGRQELDDFLGALESRANEVVVQIERRDRVTAAYFASELEDLGESTRQERGILLHRSIDQAVRPRFDAAMDLGKAFSDLAEETALRGDDPAALRRALPELEQIRAEAQAMAGP